MYCNRCGAVINDTTKPCPTCGMMVNNMGYGNNMNPNMNPNMMNNGVNYNGVNYNNQQQKRGGFSTFIIVGVVIMGLFFLTSMLSTTFSTIDAENDSGVFNGVNYTLKYDPQVWYKYESDDEYFILRNRADDQALFLLPTEYTPISGVDLTTENGRDYVHGELYKSFKTTSEIRYSNIMSRIEKLSDSSYYYMSADFYSIEYSYGGRAYVLMSSDGNTLMCLLREGNKDADDIESEVFDLFRNITM